MVGLKKQKHKGQTDVCHGELKFQHFWNNTRAEGPFWEKNLTATMNMKVGKEKLSNFIVHSV